MAFLASFLTPAVLRIGGVVLVVAGLSGAGFYIESLRVQAAGATQAKAQVAALQKASALLAAQQSAAVADAARITAENADLKASIANVPDSVACLTSAPVAALLERLHQAAPAAAKPAGVSQPAAVRRRAHPATNGH